MVATDEKIKHSTRKTQNAQATHEQVGKDEERQQAKLNTLHRDLQTARRAADEATGPFHVSSIVANSIIVGVSYH